MHALVSPKARTTLCSNEQAFGISNKAKLPVPLLKVPVSTRRLEQILSQLAIDLLAMEATQPPCQSVLYSQSGEFETVKITRFLVKQDSASYQGQK
jgi:hypothetical protein